MARVHFTQPESSFSQDIFQDEALLSVTEISKRFGPFTAVQPLSFTLRRGEILGLLGPNGCGKSTTFKMLCGLLPPTSGKAHLWGQDVSLRRTHSMHSRMGYMPQKFALYRPLTVLQNLTFFAGLYGLADRQAQTQINEIIQLLALVEYQEDTVENLPLGLIQKVSFACALVHRPEILFLDEPTSGVDPMTRQEFWKILLAVNQSGVSIIVTTHFLEEAQYCHQILLMNQGHKIALGSPLELFHNARKHHPHVHTMGDLFLWYLTQPLKTPL
jgi:ABC-2 type transport system ATP-binding protein